MFYKKTDELLSLIGKLSKTQESYAIAVFSEMLVLWTKKKCLRWIRRACNCNVVFWVIIVHCSHGLRDILIGIGAGGKR